MSSHPTDYQGSVMDALREAIGQQIPNSRAAFAGRSMLERQPQVYGAIAHLMQGDAPPVHAVDSLKTRTPARLEPGLASHGWPPAIEIQQTIGVRT